ncbi:MAG TPA: hypothetical protein DCL73_08995 [Treponema sp.]|nr:hypothetical protein [Treponema sp.]
MRSSVKKIFIPAGIAAVSIIVIFLFRTVQSGSLWKGYRIIYVSADCDNKYAETVIEKAGCSGVIDLASQYIPLTLAADTPEVSLAAAGAAEKDGYLSKRTAYFFDKGGKYQLYYVPEGQMEKAEAAVQSFLQAGIGAGIDTQTDYPWMIPVICFLFAVFLVFLSAHRVVFACFSAVPVFFSTCMPFYSAASSVCLLLYALFLVQQVWGRKNAAEFILTNGTVLLFTVSSLVIAVMTSVSCGLIFADAVAGTAAVVYLLFQAEQKHDEKYSFVPVMIRSADAAQFRTKKAKRGLAACAAFIVVLTGILLLSADFSRVSKRLQLPSARTGNITDGLPSLDDYVAWCWNARTMPYRSLHDSDEREQQKPKDGDSVVFTHYSESDKGITESDTAMKFDASFRKEVVAQIDELNFPAVEKLLKKQGRARAGYAFSASGGGTAYLLLMIISFCIPMFFLAHIYLLTGRWSKTK